MAAEVLKRNLEFDTMLLTDVFLIERLQILQEGAEGKTMRVRGVFQRAGEANSNGRIYPNTVLEGQLGKLQPLIEGRRLCGELDHPTNDTVKLSNASHLITKLEMKGNEVIGEAEILNTPAGLTAKALINGGVKIGISSRGMGTLSESSDGKKIVNEDFNLITFDLVADPSTRGAYPELSESKRTKFINESKAKLEKESNLVKLLKSRFDEAYTQYNEAKKPKITRKSKKQLLGNRGKLDVDGDGQIEGSDLAKLRMMRKKFLKKKMNEGAFSALRKYGSAARQLGGNAIMGAGGILGGAYGAFKQGAKDAQTGDRVVGIPRMGIPTPKEKPEIAPPEVKPEIAPPKETPPEPKRRLSPEEIDKLRNTPEAIAKRAGRREVQTKAGEDFTFTHTTPGQRTASRDLTAAEQGGRFARGGSVATALQQARQKLPGLGARNFKRSARKAISQGGRVGVGSTGKPIQQPLRAHTEYDVVGSILLEMIEKRRIRN